MVGRSGRPLMMTSANETMEYFTQNVRETTETREGRREKEEGKNKPRWNNKNNCSNVMCSKRFACVDRWIYTCLRYAMSCGTSAIATLLCHSIVCVIFVSMYECNFGECTHSVGNTQNSYTWTPKPNY